MFAFPELAQSWVRVQTSARPVLTQSPTSTAPTRSRAPAPIRRAADRRSVALSRRHDCLAGGPERGATRGRVLEPARAHPARDAPCIAWGNRQLPGLCASTWGRARSWWRSPRRPKAAGICGHTALVPCGSVAPLRLLTHRRMVQSVRPAPDIEARCLWPEVAQFGAHG